MPATTTTPQTDRTTLARPNGDVEHKYESAQTTTKPDEQDPADTGLAGEDGGPRFAKPTDDDIDAYLRNPDYDDLMEVLRHIRSRALSWHGVGRALYEWDPVLGRRAFHEWSAGLIMDNSDRLAPNEWEDVIAAWEDVKNDPKPAELSVEDIFIRVMVLGCGDTEGFAEPVRADAIARQYYYLEGKGIVRRLRGRTWQIMSDAQARRELKAQHRADGKPDKGETLSEVEKIIHRIETKRAVDGIAPFPHERKDVVHYAGQRILNESKNQPVIPLKGDGREWCQGFPFTAKLIDDIFTPEAKDYVLDWTADAYQGLIEGRLTKGPAMVLTGDTGRGKTLFTNVVIGGLMGGNADASSFLMGSQWNEHLFDNPVWTIDDSLAASDHHAHNKFSTMMKKAVANHDFEVNGKYKKAVKLPWLGRLVITANKDSESLRIIPNMELSVRDKISLIKLRDDAPTVELPEGTPAGMTAGDIVREELPAFAGWLMNRKIKPTVKDTRFGVVAYQDEELLATAQQNHANAPFEELVDEWRNSWFLTPAQLTSCEAQQQIEYKEGGSGPNIELTATQLYERMTKDFSPVKNAARKLSSNHVGRNLSSMVTSRCTWVSKRLKNGTSLYKILNPHFVGPPTAAGA